MSGVSKPRVSVIIPAHNAGAFLRPAVESVLADEVDGLELIVVDDGSTDASLKTLAGLPVRVAAQGNRGEAAARNLGVRLAEGRFVTFLDADDLLTPGGLEPRLRHLESHEDCWAVGGLPTALIGARGERVAEVFERMAAKLAFPMTLSPSFYKSGKFFPVSCSLYAYRREAMIHVGPYDETLAAAPDADFHFRFLAAAEIPVLRAATFARRLHASNLSMDAARSKAVAFRPEILEAIRVVNARHGLAPAEIIPWEREYL